MLYLIYAESANYAGYGQHFVVEAADEDEARSAAEDAINEYFYEQDGEQLEEEDVDCEGFYGSICSCEEFGPGHKTWEFYLDPSQDEFYTKVNV